MDVISATLAREACDAGKAWATGLKPGDRFVGARPAAEARFPGSKTAQDYFVIVALYFLPQRITVTREGNVITEIDHLGAPR